MPKKAEHDRGGAGLFGGEALLKEAPLARRMRPLTFDEFAGQKHVLAPGMPLRRFAEEGRNYSWIIFGPPGCGKTAFAELVASAAGAVFTALNAVTSNVAELKAALQAAAGRREYEGRRTVLFIDEIHRFNRLQQDALLPAVENGTVHLYGATTQNPAFCINGALLSRCQLVEFKPLFADDLFPLIDRALHDSARGLGEKNLTMEEDARLALIQYSSGDARRLLNLLELAAEATVGGGEITLSTLKDVCAGQAAPIYDRDGDNHYDIASAFIKSMRGSDPDATIYWLARMLAGGEDPNFIARRIVIAASEDVGLADSGALSIAVAAAEAALMLGMPEARIPLAHAALRVALAPKSNSAYTALDAALADVRERGPLPVPDHLRDASYTTAKRLQRGLGYVYPHDHPSHWVRQDYLTEARALYKNSGIGAEAQLGKWLDFLRERK
jgi:putative ATPase